jgi:hypothetical protein
MSWSWFFRDSIYVGSMISVLYLVLGFILFKAKPLEDWLADFRGKRFSLTYIAVAFLALRGLLWLIDRYHTFASR